METEITKTLRKFKKEDYEYFLKCWGKLKIKDFVKSDNMLTTLSKTEFISKTKVLFKSKKLKLRDLHNLDLIYIQKYSKTKLWTVHRLTKIPGEEWKTQNPSEFQETLESELKMFYNAEVCVRVHNQVFWIRVSLQENKSALNQRPSPACVAYIVHHPRTEYLMITGLTVKYSQCVLQAFMNVLECHEESILPLKGHHLNSLMQLVINKQSQGSFSSYRLCEVDDNPLAESRSRKRKRTVVVDDDDEDGDPQILNENRKQKKRNLEILQATFGDHPQPVLEKVEYKLETKFRGSAYAPAMSTEDIFHCSVKFEGPNVIEGIKNLAKAGLAELPMKDHLGKIHSMAQSTFNLRMKGAGNRTKDSSALASSR